MRSGRDSRTDAGAANRSTQADDCTDRSSPRDRTDDCSRNNCTNCGTDSHDSAPQLHETGFVRCHGQGRRSGIQRQTDRYDLRAFR